MKAGVAMCEGQDDRTSVAPCLTRGPGLINHIDVSMSQSFLLMFLDPGSKAGMTMCEGWRDNV